MTIGALFSRIRHVLSSLLPLALGPHPQRELTLTPRGGFAGSPRGVAAGAFPLALGPHPQRDLTLTPRAGFTCPPRGVAAGAPHARPTRPT